MTSAPEPARPGERSSGKGLYAAKGWYTQRLQGFVALAVRRGISPDVFTYVGILGGLLSAVVLYAASRTPSGWWALAMAAALALRLAGANLDGAVARARGVSRPWGFVLNEIGDRASDLLVMVVLAVVSGSWWGAIGLAGSTLPTFASLAVCAAGGPRVNGGPVGKTERCALLVLAVALAPWWSSYAPIAGVIGIGGLVTAILRLRYGAQVLAGVGAVGADGAAAKDVP